MAADLRRVLLAVERTLRLWPALGGSRIDVNEPGNEDPGRCPWVGIYDGDCDMTPRVLGPVSNGWLAQAQIVVALQQVSRISGREAWDKLHRLREEVEMALRANTSLTDDSGSAAHYLARIRLAQGPRSGTTEGGYFYSSVVLTADYVLKA